jgi:multiple sugar transport system ATP-binding protein
MGFIELNEVSKFYNDDLLAVDNVSLSIEDGEFVVLVGPSGSGKSTILRMIAGLESVTDGEIVLDNEDITTEKPRERDLAMVFQNYALYPHLTAGQNIGFGLKMRGEETEEAIESRVLEAAEMMGIEELLDDYPKKLSGGQQQRVALGRAIVRDSEAFLMDEPLSNLDAKLRSEMRTEIQRLQSELDMTTIYVTHDQTEAMTMGDRIAILDQGQLQQIATPLEAYYDPANKFVAGFIGSPSMNFLDVLVERSDGGHHLVNDSFDLTVSEEFAGKTPQVERATLGIRPEDIEVKPTTADQTLNVEVDVVEPLGKEQIIYFDLVDASFTASTTGYQSVEEDETIEVRFPESRIHLFDVESGETIKQRSATDEEPPAMEQL